MNNRFNEILSYFSLLNCKFLLENRLIDIFPNCFSFHSLNRKSKDSVKTYLYNLNNITLQASTDLYLVVVVLDSSIKNYIATLIAHVHIHHVVNITSTEVELFAIRCSINQAICLPNTNWIVVIMDFIHTAKKIFDLLLHPYQIYSSAISYELRKFFKQNSNNSIEFWDFSSHCKWSLHDIVNRETKKFNLTPIFSYKLLWDFNRKNECNNILNS